MTYSYNQISQYLTCPRRYRHRYLDGWQEKDTRAVMLFGRAFEKALAAYFLHEDSAAVLFREWDVWRNQDLHYSKGDTWDRMLQQGVQLLDRFCQDDRIRIRAPRQNLQIKFARPLSGKNDFVAYVDGIGRLDGTRCLLEWKTTSATQRSRMGSSFLTCSSFATRGSPASRKWPKLFSFASAWLKFNTFARQLPM